MKNEKLKMLVDALRSGKFKQTAGSLHRITLGGDRFCCLGVACQIYQEVVGGLLIQRDAGISKCAYNGMYGTLPEVVSEWFGITDSGRFDTNTIPCSLMALNDKGKTFEEIADAIEKYEDELLYAFDLEKEMINAH